MALTVDTNCPYGNACDIAVSETENACEISFAADPHGGPECLWFCFRVEDDDATPDYPEIRLTLKHAETMLGARQPGNMRPVIRRSGGDWERLAAGQVNAVPDGRLTVSWMIDAPEPWTDVAYCYPYGPPEVKSLVEAGSGYWNAETIGVSPEARSIVRLANEYGEPDGQRPGLYLIARQHSGETPGSWVLDGLLRQMADFGEQAPLVWAVPLTNIDGVEQGDYGKDNFPYDLNRAWGIEPMRHETLVMQRDMQRWRERCQPALAIDFHAPGGCEAEGMYCFMQNGNDETKQLDAATQEWAAAVQTGIGPQYAAQDFGRIATYASRWETPRFGTYCAETLQIPALSIETPYAMAGDKVLEVADYREAGRSISRAIVQQLQEHAST